MENKKLIQLGCAGALIVVGLIAFLVLNPIVMISAGERGVVLEWGAVSDKILGEGIHWVMPIKNNVKEMDVKIQKEEKSTASASKDLQTVTSQIAINYHLQPDKVNKLWQEVGKDYSIRIIAPAIEEFVKKTTAQYTAEELITKRNEVKEALREALVINLSNRYVIVDDIFITNFDFSSVFNSAIEAKVTAEQKALEAKNKLEQIKFEAEQRIAAAKAEAEAIRIQAQAITQQGGKDYVQLKAIEKWSGELPQYMIPGSAVPFLQLEYQK